MKGLHIITMRPTSIYWRLIAMQLGVAELSVALDAWYAHSNAAWYQRDEGQS